VWSLRFLAADLVRLANVPAVLVIHHRTEHYHAVAEAELSMRYRTVRCFIDCVLRKAEHIAKPSDGSFRVAIPQPQNTRSACVFGTSGHGPVSLESTSSRSNPIYRSRQ